MTVTPSPPVPGGPPTPPILISGNSQITTNADASTGGNITVNAGGSPLTLQDSVINATAGAAGNGGNITINEVGLTILSDSAILARADSGNGGAINIFSIPGALFIEDSESLISAQSKTGNSGTVNINAPQTDLNSGLAVPEVSVARAAELSSNACRHDRNHSTFVREGQGGTTQDPDGYLTGQSMNGTAPASSAPAKATKNSAPADRAAVLAAATASSPGCW
jgi:large exoprotein involved in heme utilization and adhesion